MSTPRGPAWLDRWPSWAFLAIMGGLIALAVLLSFAFPTTFWNPPEPAFVQNDARCGLYGGHLEGFGFFYNYYWGPILCDEGYTWINTSTWALLLGLMLLWAYRLTTEMKERVEFGLVMAVTPYLLWGSVFRVLEDSDLFAPFNRLPVPPAGDGFLDHSLGALFITPIIYVEVTFIAVGFLLLGHAAKKVAERRSIGHGLAHVAYGFLIAELLYVALYASTPTYIRWMPHPWVPLAAGAVSWFVVWRDASWRRRISPHTVMGAWGLYFLLLGTYYVFRYMTGGVEGWAPGTPDPESLQYPAPTSGVQNWPVQWWVLVAMFVAPLLIAAATAVCGIILSRPRAGIPPVVGPDPGPAERALHPDARKGREHGPVALTLSVIVLIQAFAAFFTILGLRDLAQRHMADAWGAPGWGQTLAFLSAGPLVLVAGAWVAKGLWAGPLGWHPTMIHYADPLNLLMVFGQMCDSLMTSLGLDVFNYGEKHVLPRTLIENVESWNLPSPIGDFPAALVMIPLKLFIVLLVVSVIDAGADEDLQGKRNFVGLVKLAIIMVGLSPGIRDGVRLAMST